MLLNLSDLLRIDRYDTSSQLLAGKASSHDQYIKGLLGDIETINKPVLPMGELHK